MAVVAGTGASGGSGSGGAVTGSVSVNDGTNPLIKATVAQFHNLDNQSLPSTAQGLLTGGVAQIVNPVGNVDRQRETGSDNISAVGVATGTQQLKSRITVSTVGASVANATSLVLSATKTTNRGVPAWVQVGSVITLEPGTANQEQVVVTAVNYGSNTVTVQGNNAAAPKGTVFAHGSGVTAITASYNESVDATIVDGSSPAGVNAGAAYLFNAASNGGTGGVEFERSFLGELMGATGVGAAIATEYEDTSGGPVLASGVVSGLRLMPAQGLLGVGLGSGAVTASVVGNATLVFASAAATNTITAGHAVQLSGGATPEMVFVSQGWVPGSSATVPVQSPVVNAGQTLARWSQFATAGPGLAGFLAHGIGIEEEALFDPVSGLYYVERAATQDNVPSQNVVLEAPGLTNGSGNIDRQRNNYGGVLDNGTFTNTSNGGVSTNYNHRGAVFVFYVSAVSGTTPSLTIKIQGLDGFTGAPYDILNAATAPITATGTYTLEVYPGISEAANRKVSDVLPRAFRAVYTISGTTPSFSIGAGANFVV